MSSRRGIQTIDRFGRRTKLPGTELKLSFYNLVLFSILVFFPATNADAIEAEKTRKTHIIIGVVVAMVGLVLIIVVILCFVRRRRKGKGDLRHAKKRSTQKKAKNEKNKNKKKLKLTKKDIQQSRRLTSEGVRNL